MTEREPGRVLIVGAGIAGLAAAGALRRAGLDAEVVERATSWAPVGTGIFLQGNAVRALDELGIADAVRACSAPLATHRMLAPGGNLVAEVDLVALWDGVGRPLGTHRAVLHEALRQQADGVPIRLGVHPLALSQGPDHVDVAFSDGTTGDYGIVIGADGVRSSIRALAVPGDPPAYSGEVYWRFVVACCPDTVSGWTGILDGRGGMLGLVPIGDGRVYGFGQVARPDPVLDTPVLTAFLERFGRLPEPAASVVAQVTETTPLHFGPGEEIHQDPWHVGRVVLIGDAAHAVPPNMSQGAAMAMEDAIVLAQELGRHDRTMIERLDAFTRRRRDRVEWVRSQTTIRRAAAQRPPHERTATLARDATALAIEAFGPLTSPI